MADNGMNNYVVVEGLLSEIGIKEDTYTKDGTTYDCIRGDVKVRVVMPLVRDGEPVELEVPCRFFTRKYTNAGNENPSYASLQKLIKEGKSIAAVGIDEADAIRITGASVTMQEYYTPDGRFVTFPAIKASFINPIKRSDMTMKANADNEIIISNMKMLTDKEGIETGTLMITGITMGYNDYCDVIPFVTDNPKYVAAIQSTYKEGDVILVHSKLNFSSRTETVIEEVEIGDPIEKQRTVSVSDLVIAGVKTSENEYDDARIKAALSKREARLAEAKLKSEKKGTSERSKATQQSREDLGF